MYYYTQNCIQSSRSLLEMNGVVLGMEQIWKRKDTNVPGLVELTNVSRHYAYMFKMVKSLNKYDRVLLPLDCLLFYK